MNMKRKRLLKLSDESFLMSQVQMAKKSHGSEGEVPNEYWENSVHISSASNSNILCDYIFMFYAIKVAPMCIQF